MGRGMSGGPMLSEGDRERLARILGLCGSAHAGERAAAALKAHEFIRSRGWTWPDVLNPPPARVHRQEPPPAPEPQAAPTRMSPAAAVWCLKNGRHLLTEWERAFLVSLASFPRLSGKQRRRLKQIVLKIEAATA